MATSTALPGEKYPYVRDKSGDDPVDRLQACSAISWGAIVAGGAAAAALSLILLILGVGLGLSSVSPWSGAGIQADTFGVSTIVWLTLTQLLASALGGYLAGRLRVRWTGVHRDEVYFRDTAHGFLSWAVASLATAALLTSTIASILGSGAQTAASAVGGASAMAVEATVGARGPGDAGEASLRYFIDTLFRRDLAASTTSTAESPAPDAGARASNSELGEAARIFMNASRTQPLPPEDLRYLAQMVAQRTGLSQAEAEKRVSTSYAQAQSRLNEVEIAAREATDQARKVSAYAALWLFGTLLIGAFAASWAATLGGWQRDN